MAVDWNTISTAIAVVISLFVGYVIPKMQYKKTIYLNQKQKEAAMNLMTEIKKAIADGKITPNETIEILKQFESVFETKESEEIDEIIKIAMQLLNKEE